MSISTNIVFKLKLLLHSIFIKIYTQFTCVLELAIVGNFFLQITPFFWIEEALHCWCALVWSKHVGNQLLTAMQTVDGHLVTVWPSNRVNSTIHYNSSVYAQGQTKWPGTYFPQLLSQALRILGCSFGGCSVGYSVAHFTPMLYLLNVEMKCLVVQSTSALSSDWQGKGPNEISRHPQIVKSKQKRRRCPIAVWITSYTNSWSLAKSEKM